MNRLVHFADSRPITAALLIVSMLALFFMIFFWRKNVEYLTMKRKDCPTEHLLKRDLFNFIKWFAIILALSSIIIKF